MIYSIKSLLSIDFWHGTINLLQNRISFEDNVLTYLAKFYLSYQVHVEYFKMIFHFPSIIVALSLMIVFLIKGIFPFLKRILVFVSNYDLKWLLRWQKFVCYVRIYKKILSSCELSGKLMQIFLAFNTIYRLYILKFE
jgi:hypothetical protein